MSDLTITGSVPFSIDLHKYMRRTPRGKIKIAAKSQSTQAIRIIVFTLFALAIYAFSAFDYDNINLGEAVGSTLNNVKILFGQPRLTYTSLSGALYALLVTFSLGALSTIFGAVIAFFGALLCAKNIANPKVANIIKGFVAFIRAVPTILWVLIFTVAAGLGSVAAVAGLTFHSVAYLIKAYSESIEEMDDGVIEALKASGAGFWQIIFQAVVPSSISYMAAWTFLRFEINFTNAIAMGAAAGAGGIGYELFMAGTYYFDLRELGFITYIVVAAVIVLEVIATRVKEKVR